MNELNIFTDASVNTKSKTGFGAYLKLTDLTLSPDFLKKYITTIKFENTSSSRLELQTLLHALNNSKYAYDKITIYTDSQTIKELAARRERLEKSNFISGKNKVLKNHDLYKKFYKFCDESTIEIVKLTGHKKTKEKNYIDKIFSIVDKESRKALRSFTNKKQ
ncbi:MAG: RNase H family protein [Thermodesulfobacteriota bacterium]